MSASVAVLHDDEAGLVKTVDAGQEVGGDVG